MIEHSGGYSMYSRAALWRLGDGVLEETGKRGRVRRWPLGEIREIRLSYDPAKTERRRYRCEVDLADGARLVIPSTDFRGPLTSEDHAATYVPFVEALVREASAANPALRLRTGRPYPGYPLQFLWCGLALVAFTIGMAAFAGMPPLEIANMVGLAISGYLALSFPFIYRNWPAPFDPDAIPPGVLPALPSGDGR